MSDFYVGYLQVPRGLVRFLRIAVPVALWGLVVTGLALGRSQRDPGGAVWDDGHIATFSGTVVARPYPMLVMEGGGAMLLAEEGKHGTNRAAGADGKRVIARGYVLRRDGRMMLELEPGESGLRTEGDGAAVGTRKLGEAAVRGEIVDSKCYLGAMKPGEGKTHKECATLCIRGGIPAVLLGADGWYLVADAEGGPIDSENLKFVGDAVEASGEVWEVGAVRVLRVRSVRRE